MVCSFYSIVSSRLIIISRGVICAAFLVLMTGCTQDLESHPRFKDMSNQLQQTNDDLAAAQRQLQVLNADLNQLTLDVQKLLKGQGGTGSAAEVQALEQRILQLENTLKNSSQALNTANSKIGELQTKYDRLSDQMSSVSAKANQPRPAIQATVTRKGEAEAKSDVQPAPERQASGQYHLVEKGESLEEIAKEYKVSVALIREANRLPAGRDPVAGQPIFVPTAVN